MRAVFTCCPGKHGQLVALFYDVHAGAATAAQCVQAGVVGFVLHPPLMPPAVLYSKACRNGENQRRKLGSGC
eukprot:17438-Pelagomonas_calceolata.AAC.2